MRLTKYDKFKATTTAGTGGGASSSGDGGDAPSRGTGYERELWGQVDTGDNDIIGGMKIAGNVIIKATQIPEEDAEGDVGSGEYEEYVEENGDLEVEGDIYTHGHLYVNYPEAHDTGTKTCVASLLKTQEYNLNKEIERAQGAEKANADNIKSNKTLIDQLFDLVCPVGSIVAFNGAGTIPSNWAICDGSNGTPDLRDRFIKGVGTASEVGQTGGQKEITLSAAQLPSHRHSVTLTPTDWFVMSKTNTLVEEVFDKGGSSNFCLYTGGDGGANYNTIGSVSGNTDYAGTTVSDKGETVKTEPPYYTLIFIQRVS